MLKARIYSYLKSSSGFLSVTLAPAGTDSVINTLPPITESAPMTVFPPSIVAPEYIVTLSSIVGCLFTFAKSWPLLVESAPRVTP